MNRMPRGTFTGLSHFFTIVNCRPIQCVLMYGILTRVRWYLRRSQFCCLLTSSMKSARRTMQSCGMPLLVQPLKKLLLFGGLSAKTRPVSGAIQSSSQPEAVRFFLCLFWEVCLKVWMTPISDAKEKSHCFHHLRYNLDAETFPAPSCEQHWFCGQQPIFLFVVGSSLRNGVGMK